MHFYCFVWNSFRFLSEKHSDFPESDKKPNSADEAALNEGEAKTFNSDSSSEDELEELLERVSSRKDQLNVKLKTLTDRVAFWEKRADWWVNASCERILKLSYRNEMLFWDRVLLDSRETRTRNKYQRKDQKYLSSLSVLWQIYTTLVNFYAVLAMVLYNSSVLHNINISMLALLISASNSMVQSLKEWC